MATFNPVDAAAAAVGLRFVRVLECQKVETAGQG